MVTRVSDAKLKAQEKESLERELRVRDWRNERRRQLRKAVQIVPCSREFEFGPPSGSLHVDVSIIVWNADTQAEAADKLDAFLEHVRRQGWDTFVSDAETAEDAA